MIPISVIIVMLILMVVCLYDKEQSMKKEILYLNKIYHYRKSLVFKNGIHRYASDFKIQYLFKTIKKYNMLLKNIETKNPEEYDDILECIYFENLYLLDLFLGYKKYNVVNKVRKEFKDKKL